MSNGTVQSLAALLNLSNQHTSNDNITYYRPGKHKHADNKIITAGKATIFHANDRWTSLLTVCGLFLLPGVPTTAGLPDLFPPLFCFFPEDMFGAAEVRKAP